MAAAARVPALSRIPLVEIEETAELLRWLAARAVLLGYQRHTFAPDGTASVVAGSGLGLLRTTGPFHSALSTPGVPRTGGPALLVLGTPATRSTVHRPSYLESAVVRTFDADGRVDGEHRFVGLFTEAAARESVLDLPVVRRKVRAVIERSGFPLLSHSGSDLLQILETYPRGELLQADVEDLEQVAMAVLHLQERRQLRLFLRRDADGTLVSCLVYLPRDLYTTQVRLGLEQVLRAELQATSVDHTARVTESVLARLHFVARVEAGGRLRDVEPATLQRQLAEVARSWSEDLSEALLDRLGEQAAHRLQRSHPEVFPDAYRHDFAAADAVDDLLTIDALPATGGLALRLYRPAGADRTGLRFKVCSSTPVSLSAVLPVLQHMAVEVLDSRPYSLHGADPAWIYDFGLRVTGALPDDTVGLDELFQQAFAAVWAGEAEDDGFNALVLRAGLSWQRAGVLRTYARYLRQAGWTYSQDYVERCLATHVAVARLLVRLFDAQFAPDITPEHNREAYAKDLTAEIERAVELVAVLDEDRILRALLRAVRATTRTSFFAAEKPYLALKFNPQLLPDLPQPRPRHEIWVCSPRVEGVHLRFGDVARGGLRWSDRREDFRTEVLGLVKAQSVKNAVIVPVGAKGGFVGKRLPDPADREAYLAEGVASYRTFISGMLDLTDNLIDGQVVPPAGVLRRDGDDTYLVVAADKGTATFSDIANALAVERGFWLGDAFASGGSAGYDHKAMGITARGAWESVARHFRELGVDVQSRDVTVVGIGDMSGDVFGNGMLLSRHLRLVAAFDHRHIFLDPEPDATTSYDERARLFALPRSSWADYSPGLISSGGGVHPRTAKSIPLSPEVRSRLGLPDDTESLTPAALMTAILLAPVDLLWNGAIGTYVKASTEDHIDVGDKANDAVRVDGTQLRCQVVGEGGNLGFTQLGRVEAARAGVRLNTDAIDNSAGVDCSDHEVNIKVLLSQAVQAGELTYEQRNALLVQMTDDVARLVLRDNYEQNILLGNARASARTMVSVHRRYIRALELAGLLDRTLEFLPSGRELEARATAGAGLTSPELAVLAAYEKNTAKTRLLTTGLPDEPWFERELHGYFPARLTERYADRLGAHPLRRQIITTRVVNDLVNHAGITFAFRAGEESGAELEDIVRAYTVAREVFGLRDYWSAVEGLDGRLPTEVQVSLHLGARRLLDRVVRWLLQRRAAETDVEAQIARFGPPLAVLLPLVPDLVQGDERVSLQASLQQRVDQAIPSALAGRASALLHAFPLLHVVELAVRHDEDPAVVAHLHYALMALFGVDALLSRITALPRGDRWPALARAALRDDLYAAAADLTSAVLTSTPLGPVEDRIGEWERRNAQVLLPARVRLAEIAATDTADLATLTVAVRTLRTLHS